MAPMIRFQISRFLVGKRAFFNNLQLELKEGGNTILFGHNGTGKTLLVNLLLGIQRAPSGSLAYAADFNPQKNAILISFEAQKKINELERSRDDSDFLESAFDPGTLASTFIRSGAPENQEFRQICERFKIQHILNQGIRYLSTGETRKVMIAKAILQKPKLIVLDSPLEGLDVASKQIVLQALQELAQMPFTLLLVTNHLQDLEFLIHWPHVLNLKDDGRLEQTTVNELIVSDRYKESPINYQSPTNLPLIPTQNQTECIKENTELIRLDQVTLSYGDREVICNLSWRVCMGEHWAIIGPNGAGKSTLLNTISGENSKAYGKEIYLFGRKRGSGETVWDIKRRFGILSSALHLGYVQRMTALGVIESGFFDTIGLYQACDEEKRSIARQWLALLNLQSLESQLFGALSFGQQRLVLFARSMVKIPDLLILDEPCIGLDDHYRRAVLDLVEYVATHFPVQILFVSHNEADRPRCITHQLQFVETVLGRYSIHQSKIGSGDSD